MALRSRIFGLELVGDPRPRGPDGRRTVAVSTRPCAAGSAPAAGLIAGAVLALTPVAALMFRFNNPDALLALLMALACYFVLRALEDGRTKWLVWAGVAIGFAFLAKTLQAFLILPPLAMVYAVCAPVDAAEAVRSAGRSRGLAMVVSGGWWVAIVELWPASSRPYIGGSQNNSFLELTFGYNGLGRLNGEETGSVGGGGGARRHGGGSGARPAWDRMFNSEIGGQISWLLPAALILLVAGLVADAAGQADVRRPAAAFLVWGGSLLITLVIFSYMAGHLPPVLHDRPGPLHRGAGRHGRGDAVGEARRAVGLARPSRPAVVVGGAAWGVRPRSTAPPTTCPGCVAVWSGGLVAALGLLFVARLGRQLGAAVRRRWASWPRWPVRRRTR